MPRQIRPITRVPLGSREHETFTHSLNIGQRTDESTPLLADSAASRSDFSDERDPLLDSIYESCLDVCCPVS
jgi:hypothetical protein